MRARAALEPLAPLGLGAERLAATAAAMARARAALEQATAGLARDGADARAGGGCADRRAPRWRSAPEELRLRLLAGALLLGGGGALAAAAGVAGGARWRR